VKDRFYTMAKCGCEFSYGVWFSCARHNTPHSQHGQPDRAPWCDECYADKSPAGAVTPTGEGPDAVQSPASDPNLGPAPEGVNT